MEYSMDRLAEGQSSEKKQRRLSLKGAAVALILAMHGLGLYFLLLPARQLKQYTEVAFLTLMPVRPATPIAATQLPLPISPPRPSVRAPAFKTPPASVSPPAVNETITLPAVDELALTPAAPVPEDLRARARLSVAAIDKAMRKETPWLAPAPLENQTRFQKRVASAYRGGPLVTLEEYLTPDGRPATRVRGASGSSKCYAMPENPGSGADPFKTGGKVKQVACP